MTTATKSPWIQTFTNVHFDILNPTLDMIRMDDIAHHLAMQCRFTGATKFHYSVAQHAVYCSRIVAPEFAFEALNHDDSEAYIADMSRPLKYFTECGHHYLDIERPLERIIAARFGLPAYMSPEVKQADNAMLFAEKAQLMQPCDWTSSASGTGEPANVVIEKWSPERAEIEFRTRFFELAGPSLLATLYPGCLVYASHA
jgi:uncharacterized protein